MLSIGEFSKICRVSTKTLRYYEEIGLLLPGQVNSGNGYRYYSIGQLDTMLLIERLKAYGFSLDEIKALLCTEDPQHEKLYLRMAEKKKQLEKQMQEYANTLEQLNSDLENAANGKSIMSFLTDIKVRLAEVPEMRLLSVRKSILEHEFADAYRDCFGSLLKWLKDKRLTPAAPPMVLFHSAEYTPQGLDTEFAIPVKEFVAGTRDFRPGLCMKTVLHGAYSGLPSVYARQFEWAEREGYECRDSLFEIYVTDPSQISDEHGLVTEIYYPVSPRPDKIHLHRPQAAD